MGARKFLEIVDVLTEHGARAKQDVHSLYSENVLCLYFECRRHLRNHGFLWLDRNGWSCLRRMISDPTPLVRAILTTNIDYDDGTCSLDLFGECIGIF